ncbi:MAG: hypothetical protein QF893_04380 [Alphaproteobacteria bacterium]|jgi:Ca-activated chloride channel family protein|nr:hypothetical protein [Alphaproteobacteria bacterium]
MSICDQVQGLLAEGGIQTVRAEAELARHLDGCVDCTAIAEALARLDSGLAALPEHDAPEAVAAASLAAVRRAVHQDRGSATAGVGRRQTAAALAASVVMLAGLNLSYSLLQLPSFEAGVDFGWSNKMVAEAPMTEAIVDAPAPTSGERFAFRKSELDSVGGRLEANQTQPQGAYADADVAEGQARDEARPEQVRIGKEAEIVARLQMQTAPAKQKAKPDMALRNQGTGNARLADLQKKPATARRLLGGKNQAENRYHAGTGASSDRSDAFERKANAEAEARTTVRGQRAGGAGMLRESGRHKGLADKLTTVGEAAKSATAKPAPVTKKRRLAATPEDARHRRLGDDKAADREAAQRPRASEPSSSVAKDSASRRYGQRRNLAAANSPEQARGEARAFLRRISAVEGPSFQEATGYWSNSYVPGDPDMHLLASRLGAWDRRQLGRPASLEQSVRPVTQLFDPPEAAALTLQLNADVASIQGPTRLRVQVGLKGAARRGGHRPAMNVGLVVDLRDKSDRTLGPRIRALVEALERARQPGDRFSLTVAGPSGGMVVAPDSFRHGPLKVAMARLFAAADGERVGPATSLVEAVSMAAASVRESAAEDAVLGASLLVLATGSSIAEPFAALERIAHENAVGGLPTSVICLGSGVATAQVDRLVAAGQGNRRVLAAAAEAEELVDRELHAASRAVARAVRLRIRLAPGVKLVDVLGSRRLDAPQAARVREAERAIDRRLARNLGITADRGADEEGIQIVIPNFYAGDSHVVLLDVVAERPGPIADVTARYKDVVFLKNGVAHARLTIPAGERPAGPLERNVLKNLLAYELAREARRYGDYFEAGRTAEAAAMIARLKALVRGLRFEVEGWSTDGDLAADEAALAGYLRVLGSPQATDPVQRRYLADSLRYAAFSKLHSRRK